MRYKPFYLAGWLAGSQAGGGGGLWLCACVGAFSSSLPSNICVSVCSPVGRLAARQPAHIFLLACCPISLAVTTGRDPVRSLDEALKLVDIDHRAPTCGPESKLECISRYRSTGTSAELSQASERLLIDRRGHLAGRRTDVKRRDETNNERVSLLVFERLSAT